MTNNQRPDTFIDLDKVLKTKFPRGYSYIPRFVISWLKKIIHQDDLNRDLNILKDYHGVEFFDKFINMMDWKITVEGAEHLPSGGSFIVVSNHPLGGPDGIMFISVFDKILPNVKFIVNDLLMYLPNVESVFLPVNKHGSNTKEYSKLIDDAFDDSNNQILIFPAGLVSREINNCIQDLEWKKSFITRAKKHKRDVIPVFFEGTNSRFFYKFAKLRKMLGVKLNLEMLFLVDELYKKRGKTFVFKIGKPISHQVFDSRKKPEDWAQWVREEVYSLAKQ
jgi:putative hemolysin